MIHKTAIIDKGAEIAKGVSVGPYAGIEKGVKIASGTTIMMHACILSGTEMGEACSVHPGAVIGGIPQDMAFKGKESFLKIGNRNVFREHSTVHRGTEEGSSTVIGDDNFIMTSVHIGHNCRLGNRNVMTSGSLLGGYVTIEDGVFIGGNAGIHQFGNVGRLAMIAGASRVDKDVPPYMLLKGDSLIYSLNVVGLKRSDMPEEAKKDIKRAYRILYRSNLNTSQALIELMKISSPEVRHLVDFIKNSKRGICSGFNK